jgi:hypothetical protein
MAIPSKAIILAQKKLAASGGGSATGAIDPQTIALVDAVLSQRKKELDAKHRAKILGGDGSRKVTAYIQLLARDAGADPGAIDGLWGPGTQHAFDSLVHLEETGTLPPLWRDIVPSRANPNGWPPENESKLIQFYGQPGTNQSTITLPYPHFLSWDRSSKLTRIGCHKKVGPSIQRVLEKVLAHYGPDGIRDLRLDVFGGCFNLRKKRGGSSWSMHAWGIALDYDPDNNQLKWGRDRATFASPAYDKWWECWEEEGWCSLGRLRNFDWMHVQAARLP